MIPKSTRFMTPVVLEDQQQKLHVAGYTANLRKNKKLQKATVESVQPIYLLEVSCNIRLVVV